MNQQQYDKMKSAKGFIAALDQSGGSTPKALLLYGIKEDSYSGDAQMFDLIHAMRSRIIMSPSFTGERILGAILFEQTMDRDIAGRGTADYLWSVKNVVPFLKVDKGLADEANGAQMMKPMPTLDALLARASAKGIFGTKMRSVIKRRRPEGHRRRCRSTVRHRQADSRCRSRAHHRTRSGHSCAGQGSCREASQGGAHQKSRCARARPARDAETHHPVGR